MASFEERLFQLGVDELAEQERQVADIRGRIPAVLAAGAVVPSLLANAVFHGQHPHGFDEVACTVLGVAGAVALLVGALSMLLPSYELGFSLKATDTYRELWTRRILEQPLIDLSLAEALHERRVENEAVVDRLKALLTLAVIGLIVEVVGFAAAAALAS
jgi:hypothetical protein